MTAGRTESVPDAAAVDPTPVEVELFTDLRSGWSRQLERFQMDRRPVLGGAGCSDRTGENRTQQVPRMDQADRSHDSTGWHLPPVSPDPTQRINQVIENLVLTPV